MKHLGAWAAWTGKWVFLQFFPTRSCLFGVDFKSKTRNPASTYFLPGVEIRFLMKPSEIGWNLCAGLFVSWLTETQFWPEPKPLEPTNGVFTLGGVFLAAWKSRHAWSPVFFRWKIAHTKSMAFVWEFASVFTLARKIAVSCSCEKNARKCEYTIRCEFEELFWPDENHQQMCGLKLVQILCWTCVTTGGTHCPLAAHGLQRWLT